MNDFDVIVVGGGHAGCEAAAAVGNMGGKVLLVTMDMTKLAQMSCNPAIGGIAKGQIVREIDALGGYTGIVTDLSSIQFKMLNKSKGPAMWSPRSQCDRAIFTSTWRKMLEDTENVSFWQDSVVSLIVNNSKVVGVETKLGIKFYASSVVLTVGTFLNGLMHVGANRAQGGRSGDAASYGITEQLKEFGFHTGRMKTGTPPRIDGRTIDFSKAEEQPGDIKLGKFSFLSKFSTSLAQRSCFVVRTDLDVHNSLRKGFEFSPLFNGSIKGIGPRYCPSIEDKLITFATKDSHQLFIEPEGVDTVEYYLNGFSTSLPYDVQIDALRKIKGFEKVRVFRPGYAIEYDYFDPTQLHDTLETKLVNDLYFAGQINGTTGYEEAAAQGLLAGINSYLKIRGRHSFVLKRNEAYIGVLIDDLITKGVDEPYRMFTSRAEYRVLLRQDNADERLTSKSFSIGLASEERVNISNTKYEALSKLLIFINEYRISPSIINPFLESLSSNIINQGTRLDKIAIRPEVVLEELFSFLNIQREDISLGEIDLNYEELLEICEIRIKYSSYIEKEAENAEKLSKFESLKIRPDFDYSLIKSLSIESRQKLDRYKPSTIGQATRISGVSPSDINALIVFLGR